MIEFIVFLIFILLFVSSMTYNIILTLKVQKLIQALFQVNLDYFIIADQLKKPDEENKGFVNFLVKSRDDAFLYITSVQGLLENFKKDVGPIIEYHERFGDVIFTPQTEQLNQIVKSYRELMNALPNEGMVE